MPGTMPLLLIGDTRTCPDLEYVSGFRATDPVVALRHGRSCELVVPELELTRATREAARCRVRTPQELGLEHVRGRDHGAVAVALLADMGLRRVEVPSTFPYAEGVALTKAGIDVRIARCPVPERAVKRPDEVARIAQAQHAAATAMRAAVAMIAESTIARGGELLRARRVLTAEDVRTHIRHVLLDHQCAARQTIVACGHQATDPHEEGHGPLRAGETIVLDIFPQHLEHGYWGDITRTVVRGRANRDIRAMYRAVSDAQRAALAAIRPGVACATVHRAAADLFRKRGYETGRDGAQMYGFFHSTGHGVGLEIHEAPGLSRVKGRLRAGHVVTVEPGLYYPELGGVRIEDTVAVTRTGYQLLARCARPLEV